jgi:hypothetical protein
VSLASSLRKNKSRTIGSTSAIKRVKSGIKSSGTKHIIEGGIKLPKVLKDMLDNLVFNNNGSYEGLGTFGLQQSGLNMTLLIADRPNAYITRITRLKQLGFPRKYVSLVNKCYHYLF